MKYIPLSSLQNQYPSISNYRNEPNSVSIKGVYEENELNIPATDFSDLGVVPNTKFRFVVRLFNNEGGNQVLNTFTSERYFNDLVRARKNKNPYFINTALNPQTFVKLYLNKIKETFDTRVSIERQYGVSVIFNNLFDSDGSINYVRFGQYLDWVVSQPTLNDIVDNGVLPSRQISSFNISDFTFPEQPDDDGFVDPTQGPGINVGGGSSNVNIPDTNDIINPNDIPTIDIPDTNDLFDPTQGPGIDFGDDRVNIPDRIIIDGQQFPITPLPNDIVGGSPIGGEGERGNLPRGGSSGNRDPFLNPGGNPEENIANEYTVRYRNQNREL